MFLCLISSFGMSQDVIEMKSGDKIKAKIIEDLELKIRYTKFKDSEGPVYVLYKKDIASITYEDGTVKRFDNQKNENNRSNSEVVIDENISGPEAEIIRIKEKSKVYNQKRHLIGFNYLQMVFLNIGMSYEFMITKSGFFGIKIPLDIGMNVKNNYLKKNTIVGTGIDFNVYPTGQGRASYLTGISMRYRYLRDNPFFYKATNSDATKAHYIGFYINNGVLFQATSFLNFSLGMGMGIRKDISRSTEPTRFDMIFDSSIIFRL